MKAKFIGQDGNRGFLNGEIYDIYTYSMNLRYSNGETIPCLMVKVKEQDKINCPYTCLETFLENWEIIKEETKSGATFTVENSMFNNEFLEKAIKEQVKCRINQIIGDFKKENPYFLTTAIKECVRAEVCNNINTELITTTAKELAKDRIAADVAKKLEDRIIFSLEYM